MIVSIDVGIRNMAYCIFSNPTKIIDWGVVNLCNNGKNITDDDKNAPICSYTTVSKKQQTLCKKRASYCNASMYITDNNDDNKTYLCTKHAKLSEKNGQFFIQTPQLSLPKIKQLKILDLKLLAVNILKIPDVLLDTDMTKKLLVDKIALYISNKVLTPVIKNKLPSCSDFTLIDIGISLKSNFDHIFLNKNGNYMNDITHIIIENQISPIANRMKSVQVMVAQYFIMYGKTDIQFISSINKLKSDDSSDQLIDKTDYSVRKKEGVKKTGKLLELCADNKWMEFFNSCKKKDDISDCYLQGVWWYNNKYN